MEGPEKPSAKIISLAEFARAKREKKPVDLEKPAHMHLLEEWLRPAFEKPEVRERFPGIDVSMILRVYMEAIDMSQDDTVPQSREYAEAATNMKPAELTAAIRKAERSGIPSHEAGKYVAIVDQILDGVDLPPVGF